MKSFRNAFFLPVEVLLAFALPLVWFGALQGSALFLLVLLPLALLCRRFDAVGRSVSLPVVVFVVLGVALTQYPDWKAVASSFFGLLIVGVALHFSYNALLERMRLGFLPLVVLLLIAPHPLAFFALWIALCCFGEIGHLGMSPKVSSRSWVLLLAVGGGLTVLTVFLPTEGLHFGSSSGSVAGGQTVSSQTTSGTEVTSTFSHTQGQPVFWDASTPISPTLRGVLQILLLAVAIFGLLAFAVAFRYRGWAPRSTVRVRSLQSFAAVTICALMGLVYLSFLPVQEKFNGTASGSTASATSQGGARVLPDDMFSSNAVGGWGSYLLIFAACLVAGILLLSFWEMWKFRSFGETKPVEPFPTLQEEELRVEAAQLPLDPETVRAIYAGFLSRMQRIGLVRSRSETPREYERRLVGQYPEFEQEALIITEVYLPVRYGGLPDRSHFEEAYVALKRLESRLPVEAQGG
ncbi:MAG: DUF4129 domain-containing protein [Deinococcaceae bacterium]